MKIDKYEKTSKGKYRIYLDNGEVIDTYDDVILFNELLLKKDIDLSLYNKILFDTNISNGYNMCCKYISVRVRSVREISDYMRRKGIDNIDLIIDKLVCDGVLDDNRFCECFIKDKLRFTSWGPYKIVNELRNSGISNDIISKYQYLLDDSYIYDKLDRLICKQINCNRKLDNNKLRNKLYNSFLRNGYKSSMIVSILNDRL